MKIIAASEAINFATLELLPLGVIVVNNQGTILFYNQREEEISGRRRMDVMGRNFFLEVAPCTAVREFHGRFKELMATEAESMAFDFTFPFILGPRHVRINLQPFRKDDESLCIIFVADITERELLREQILQSQRFSELGEVAAKVAHNFNNLLSVVQLSTELALERATPEVRKHLKVALGAVGDGAALVRRFREISQPGFTVARERIELNACVETAVGFVRHLAEAVSRTGDRKVGLRVNLMTDPLVVLGDGGELREVFLNLLRNAIEAIPGQGTVRILTSTEPGVGIVDILDDGTGMSPEVLGRIFTPMFTTKGESGTGLGLASAHSTLRRHGGAIEVTSTPGQGSHFRITLPLAE
jgi:photoactive yellow protein